MSISSVVILFACVSGPVDAPASSLSELDAAADAIAEQTPAESIARLEAALDVVQQRPHELLADPSAPERIARARLALVWAELAHDDLEAATASMDLAIRSAWSDPLPLSGLGPAVRELHDERRALLGSSTARIRVECDGCEVIIDEATSDYSSAPLLLGSHRVWLLDPNGELEPRQLDVALDEPGIMVFIDYRSTVPLPDTGPPERRRPIAPRWPKILGMTLGAGAIVAGGVLLSLDGKCRGGGTPTPQNVDSCPRVWDQATPSYMLLGIGGGLLVGASVWLTVDELRTRKRRASAMVGWTMRF